MIKTLIKHFWDARVQFAKYFIVGLSTVVVDVGTLILFKEHLGLTPVLAVVINQFIVYAYNFTLNKRWSFKNKEMPHWQIMRYMALMAFNYGFSVGSMYVFNELLGFDYRLVRMAAMAVMVSWTFVIYKWWVFKESPLEPKII